MSTKSGTPGNDVLIGTNQADTLDGGAGNDALFAGRGADVIRSGAGRDHLWGGPGNDTFDFTQWQSGDVKKLYDWNDGDVIRLPFGSAYHKAEIMSWGGVRINVFPDPVARPTLYFTIDILNRPTPLAPGAIVFEEPPQQAGAAP